MTGTEEVSGTGSAAGPERGFAVNVWSGSRTVVYGNTFVRAGVRVAGAGSADVHNNYFDETVVAVTLQTGGRVDASGNLQGAQREPENRAARRRRQRDNRRKGQ